LLNRKGQFSIIAALLVAVVLVASVMTTYSSIRYNPVAEQPQILSAVDETNFGLKEILGFTVGYYGSVLKVTGNQTYANELARTYLQSGLDQTGDVRPEWGASVNLTSLDLKTNWFSNKSYSQGNMTVTYNLAGLGISGASYSTSTRLDVQISKANQTNQAQLKILMDDSQPLINLGKNNLKLYRYVYNYSDWELVEPANIASYADGTYVLDLPQGVNGSSYVIQVEDTRGLMVLASSFSQFSSTLTWNSSSYRQDFDYVNAANSNVLGTHSNFTAQQYGPDANYDNLTEAPSGTTQVPSYPTNYNTYGSTTWASGPISYLQINDGNYLSFHSYGSSFGGSANFGYTTQGGLSSNFNSIRGSRFTTGASNGLATNISAYLGFTGSSNNFGNTNTGSSGNPINDTIRGQRFTSPATPVVAQSISAYIYCTTSAKNMKAALYDSNGNLIATTEEKSIPASGSAAWQTFNFASAPTLTANTQYELVAWSQSGTGSGDLRYSSASGGNGRNQSQSYGNWPSSAAFSTNTIQYSIYCNYLTTFNAQAAVYSSNGGTLIGTTEEKTLTTTNGWVTFNFITQPTLVASTNYVLAVETSDSSVNIYYDNGAQYFRGTSSYPTWPTTLSDQGSQREYSIYCTYSPANQYTAQVEFTGNSTAPFPWNDLVWTIDSSASTSSVSTTFQLYNSVTGQYPSSGDGFMAATLGAGNQTKPQTIIANPASFLNSSGYWKVMVTAVKSTSTPFDLNLDFVQYSPDVTNYAVDLEEQWLNVNVTNIRQDLCIKTGTMGTEPLLVQVLHGGSWQNLTTLAPNYFNNVSLAPYIDSTNLTIRFIGSNDLTDPTQDNWNIDAVYIKDEPDISFLLNLQQPTFTLEVLQNGTMRWLGQNMQLTNQTLPIPTIPVKAIHVNQTINGVNQQVPFQIEDWASNYQIPLGLTSNTTVFSNRQMIVFLLNSKVTDFTVWWDGSDAAAQTPLAYTNRYFTNDNTGASTLTNGNVTLQFGSFNVKSTVVGTTTSSTATFMRINQENSTYGAGLSYVIHHGIVRDIVQQEAEWGTGGSGIGGADGCPNLYANIVLKLPANSTYYTYQLRIMFINSTQARSITDLSPIQLTTSLSSPQLQTENGTLAGFPTLQNGTGTFLNATSGSWTAHHFSQFLSDTGKGAGIMFTDIANQKLYAFDSFSGSSSKGALKASSGLLELLPVSSSLVQFTYAYDITWQGAVATFDSTTPICSLYDGTTPAGLWILAEYPPTLTVIAKS
jgi:hypothetical protein